MASTPKKSIRTSVLLPEGYYIRLNEVAVRSGVSTAWVMRHAIQRFLDDLQNEQIPLPIELDRRTTHV